MADNLSVTISADSTKMRAQLALAQADLRSYSAAVRAAAEDIKKSGDTSAEQVVALEKASAGYNRAAREVVNLKGRISELTPQIQSASMATQANASAVNANAAALGAHTNATHNNRAASEAMVLVHEAVSGRYTKMGGSLMILMQQMGGAS
jgi:chromosome segregation ATPase